jgi:hypothetical protein
MTRKALTLVNTAQSSFHRLLVLLFGIVFTGSGLLGVYQCVGLLRDFISGATDQTSLLIGLSVTLLALLMGGAALWIVFLPDKTLSFDAASRKATLVYTYPPGVRKTRCFDFAAIRPPEVVWEADSDTRDGGCWKLKLTLPNGAILDQRKPHMNSMQEKAFAQAWCDDITALIREK